MVHLARGSVRMICLDLDGTLFTPRKEISERSRKAIKGCLDLGMEVVLVTGRFVRKRGGGVNRSAHRRDRICRQLPQNSRRGAGNPNPTGNGLGDSSAASA